MRHHLSDEPLHTGIRPCSSQKYRPLHYDPQGFLWILLPPIGKNMDKMTFHTSKLPYAGLRSNSFTIFFPYYTVNQTGVELFTARDLERSIIYWVAF